MTLHSLDRDGAITAVEEATQLLSTAPVDLRAGVLDLAAAVLALRGHPDQARDAAEEAARLAEDHGDVEVAANARATLGWVLCQLGAYDESLTTLREAGELAEKHHDLVRVARAQLNTADTLHHLGQYPAMIDAAGVGLDAASRSGVSRTLGASLGVQLGAALIALGRWDEAESTGATTLEMDPPNVLSAALYAQRSEVALARGDTQAAREQLSLARTLLGPASRMHPTALAVTRLGAELALADNRIDDARAAVGAGLSAADASLALYAWPLLIVGAQIVAHDRIRGRARSDTGDAAAEVLRTAAARLPVHTPRFRAYAAEFAAQLGEPGKSWPDVAAAWDAVQSMRSRAGWSGITQLRRTIGRRLRRRAPRPCTATGGEQPRCAAARVGQDGRMRRRSFGFCCPMWSV
jgi:tetratricopeptide (TPR) repeat protein